MPTRKTGFFSLYFSKEVFMESQSRPAAFYFLMAFLTFGTTFIGYNFGGAIGAVLGFLFSVMVNVYAIQIKAD